MTLALPYPIDPSLPSNPSPVFGDITAARGDHLRANNAEIWSNLNYLLNNLVNLWKPSVAYSSSQIVQYNNTRYICLSGHTATSDFYADWITSGYWADLGDAPASIKEWPSAVTPAGWLLITASALQTIGNTGSGATFADPKYYLLFRLLGGSLANWTALAKVNLPDHSGIYSRGAGTHNSLTKANGSKTGGFTLLQYLIDKMFGHKHSTTEQETVLGISNQVGPVKGTFSGGPVSFNTDATIIADGTNGTPNAGDETSPATVVMNYLIKV